MPFWRSSSNEKESVPVGSFELEDILVCSTHGKLYAIHKSDGSRLWKADFDSPSGVVSLFVTDSGKLLVGGYGETHCFNLLTGEKIWQNDMPKFGRESVSIVCTPSRTLQTSAYPQNYDKPQHLPPHYNEATTGEDKQIVITCTQGEVMTMDAETGETLWKYNCPKGQDHIPTAIVEPSNWKAGRPSQLVYIGAGKMIYCLNANTGNVIWTEKISNSLIGFNFMTLATSWSSRMAAETHSAFTQCPVAQTREIKVVYERKNY